MTIEPLSKKRLTTRAALQHAALKLVTTRGYSAITVDDIAAEARVSRRTFFNHFQSKVAAVFEPSPEQHARLAALLDAARPEEDGIWEALRGVSLAYASGSEERLPVHRRLFEDDPDLAMYLRFAYRPFGDALSSWLDKHLDADRIVVDVVRETFYAVQITAFMTWTVEDDPTLFYQLLERGFDVAGSGLRNI